MPRRRRRKRDRSAVEQLHREKESVERVIVCAVRKIAQQRDGLRPAVVRGKLVPWKAKVGFPGQERVQDMWPRKELVRKGEKGAGGTHCMSRRDSRLLARQKTGMDNTLLTYAEKRLRNKGIVEYKSVGKQGQACLIVKPAGMILDCSRVLSKRGEYKKLTRTKHSPKFDERTAKAAKKKPRKKPVARATKKADPGRYFK